MRLLAGFRKAAPRNFMMREPPAWIGGPLIVATFVALCWLERRRPLRRETQRKLRRNLRNGAMAALSATAIRLTEKPLTAPLAALVERRRWGLVKRAGLPPWAEVAAAVVLLDYTLYVWHVLTHKVPFLWRFHQAHHVDLDLDASTAIRFHFAEMVLSVPWRLGQIVVVGASPFSLGLWQLLTLLEIFFHHSNVRLPFALERRLCRVIVTPRMHGIHHSTVHEETDSNWSTIFSWPDYVHGTLRLDVAQDAIDIGVLAYRDPDELELDDVLKMPLTADRPSWQLHEPKRLLEKSIPLPTSAREPGETPPSEPVP